jgi:radical SAM superfamily enzyme YgiQ (UPF0313 family)
MHVFLVNVADQDYCRLLPERLNRHGGDPGRIKVMGFPPLGIETLASVVRQRGHRVSMFDTCHPQMQGSHIAAAAQQQRPDVFALSFLSVTTYGPVKALAATLKAAAPGVPVIIGGPFATMNSDRIIEDCPHIDGACVGEGEEFLPDYLEHLDDQAPVLGLTWRYRGRAIRNRPRPLIDNLDGYPYPDRSTLPIDYIQSLPVDVPAVMSLDKFCTMQTSRGCPYSCIYCDIPELGAHKWRSRSPEHVLGEMQQLSDQGYRSVYLTDDHFLINRGRISAICRGMVQRKLKFRWGCEGRVDSAAVDQLPAMKQAGCDSLCFGVESGSQKTLDRLKKHQTLRQIRDAVSAAKKHGIRWLHGFFVIGCPDETAAEIRQSFRFAAELQLDTLSFNRLQVYRGTPLWREYVQRGIIDDQADWDKWFKCCEIDPTAVPRDEVNRLRMRGYAVLFAKRLLYRPLRTSRLLRSFSRHMGAWDMLKLLYTPFRKRQFTRRPDLPTGMLAVVAGTNMADCQMS